MVFTATENDSVYAFDADSGAQLWKVSLVPPGEKVERPGQLRCSSHPTIGVTSTPVIDRAAGHHLRHRHDGLEPMAPPTTIACTRSDVTTGAEVLGGPTEITASFPTELRLDHL